MGREAATFSAGVDEAGRGCLAGPVVAGAVIWPEGLELAGLGDSKKIPPARREALALDIRRLAVASAVGLVWPGLIDRLNILEATFLAMAKAVSRLRPRPPRLVIDGDKVIPARYLRGPLSPFPDHANGPDLLQEAVVGGDALVASVSAASILAKTFRDRLMRALDRRYPGYGLAGHKGYGSAAHLEALRRLGPSRIHRLTFRGVPPEKPSPVQAALPGLGGAGRP